MPNFPDSAQRMLREYGAAAEVECDARASYHEMQGDKAVAEQWRRLKDVILRLRQR